jgi:type I restriction-modification system DNA methylase subunit
VPAGYAWPSLLKKDGDELFDHYRHTLEALGKQKGLLGLIFTKSQNKFQDPAKLRRLIVDLIDKETWVSMSADVKGDAYEGLLEKNAQDTKSGAGQYFTPRPLIQAMVDVHRPAARRDHLRPGLRHRRLSAGGARLCGEALSQPDARRRRSSARGKLHAAGSWCRPRRGCAR